MPNARIVNLITLGASLALLAGCSSGPYVDPTVRAGTFRLIHIAGVEDVGATPDNPLGRLARLAEPDLRGGRNRLQGVLTTAAGGFLTPPGAGGADTIKLLNEAGIEVATPSERELTLTESEFHERIRTATFSVISNNLTDSLGRQFQDMTRGIVMPVKTDKGMIDVGLIGLMRSTAPPAWATYTDPIEAAKKEALETRKWSQFIVALTDSSMVDDEALLAAVPGIDLVLGSHRGQSRAVTRQAGPTPIAKADVNARTAVVVTVTIPEPNAQPQIAVRIEPLDKPSVK